jgi:hypothetical protein
MMDHKCQYAEAIGRKPDWQTDDDGKTVCVFCHVDKTPVIAEKPAVKTVRK